jgi:hypothetical protein
MDTLMIPKVMLIVASEETAERLLEESFYYMGVG